MIDDQLDVHLDNILKASGSALKHYSMQKTKDDMRQALRQAIAKAEKQEPVALKRRLVKIHDALDAHLGDTDPYIDEDMTDEEVCESEPVFWAAKEIADLIGDAPWTDYTTPQHRKPLTDDQIYEMYNEPRSDAEMLAFARAIEAAHGIKE